MSIVIIGKDNKCLCDCGTKCLVDGRSGSSPRCTINDFQHKDIQVIRVDFEGGVNRHFDILTKVKEIKPKKNWIIRMYERIRKT